MNLHKASRWFVTMILFAACVVLALLAQAQSGEGGDSDPNKCHTEWDFCNSGTAAENAYHWRLGWCVAAVERGAVSVSVSACMGQEEGSVSYPRSSSSASSSSSSSASSSASSSSPSVSAEENAYYWRLGWCVAAVERGEVSVSVSECVAQQEASAPYPPSLSSVSSVPAGADPNKCYTEWDFCNSGTAEENAYFWRLGWYAAAEERGEVSVSLEEFMGGAAPPAPVIIGGPKPPPRPDETQDLPWSRALCYTVYPDQLNSSLIHICGWDATLPPGEHCRSRRTEFPWDCLRHVVADEVILGTTATFQAESTRIAATIIAGG